MKTKVELRANSISAGYDKRKILHEVSLCLPQNKISVIIGANACGKSTLLKSIARLLPIESGEIMIDGEKILSIPTKELAKVLGLLPQSPLVPEGILVGDLIARGRFPYQTLWKGMKESDYRAVDEAISLMKIDELKERRVDELSGGQRQRVWIAMALAQQTDILLLDEPTTYLDISHQIEILELLKELNQKKGTTIGMVLHDLNLSARYADYLFAVKDGKIVEEGSPKEVMTEELIRKIFNLRSMVITDPVSGTPLMIPRVGY